MLIWAALAVLFGRTKPKSAYRTLWTYLTEKDTTPQIRNRHDVAKVLRAL